MTLLPIALGVVAALAYLVRYLLLRARRAERAAERFRQEAAVTMLATSFALRREPRQDTLPGIGGWVTPARRAMGSDPGLQ